MGNYNAGKAVNVKEFPIAWELGSNSGREHRKVKYMGVFTRAVRNLSRRKVRALLVVVALSFSKAIMISIPSGILANQATTESLSENYRSIIDNMEEEIHRLCSMNY